jgi:hypothetical protein
MWYGPDSDQWRALVNTVILLTLWFSILLRVYYKSSLTSTVRNFSLIYLFYFYFYFYTEKIRIR